MLIDVLAAVGTVLAGLAAGIFLSFTSGVMPGLRRTGDAVFVDAMRSINVAVLNLAFLGPLFLPPVVLGAAAVVGWATGADPTATVLLTAAAVVGFIGAVVITGAWHVPLNIRLASSTTDATATREAFERPWNRGNLLRTLVTTAAFALAVAALVV